MDSYPGVLSQVLGYFMSEDPGYYDSPRFRHVVIKKLYESDVRQKIGWTIKMPPGLQRDAPELDNLTEETFAKVGRSLDANTIAECSQPDLRFAKCTGFVMTVAYRVSINFLRKNGFPWSHGEFSKEIVGHEPTVETEHLSDQAKALAESQELDQERASKNRLREALGWKISDKNFEIFCLAIIEGLKRREIQARFPKLTTNHIGVIVHRVSLRAARILTDPIVLLRLLGVENDNEK
jgi:hypothetical protein